MNSGTISIPGKTSATSGFIQMMHEGEAVIGSAHPGFGFGGRNSVGQSFLTSPESYQDLVINLA